jgi:hypothetical protein
MTDTRKPLMFSAEPNGGCSDGYCTWALNASVTVVVVDGYLHGLSGLSSLSGLSRHVAK